MNQEQIRKIASNYNAKEIKIGVLGSHSALEMGHGAKQEGFEVVVVCQKGREKTYTKHYRNLFDHIILLDNFSDLIEDENQEKLRRYLKQTLIMDNGNLLFKQQKKAAAIWWTKTQ